MYDEGLAERIRQTLAASAFTEQKMFGGLCFLIGGHMACGVMGGDLLVRTGPAANQEALARPFARPMDFTGRVMRGFVIVEGAGLSETSLPDWVALGLAFAASLPPSGSVPTVRARKVRVSPAQLRPRRR